MLFLAWFLWLLANWPKKYGHESHSSSKALIQSPTNTAKSQTWVTDGHIVTARDTADWTKLHTLVTRQQDTTPFSATPTVANITAGATANRTTFHRLVTRKEHLVARTAIPTTADVTNTASPTPASSAANQTGAANQTTTSADAHWSGIVYMRVQPETRCPSKNGQACYDAPQVPVQFSRKAPNDGVSGAWRAVPADALQNQTKPIPVVGPLGTAPLGAEEREKVLRPLEVQGKEEELEGKGRSMPYKKVLQWIA